MALPLYIQRSLWCPGCGAQERLTAGLCPRCYAREQHNQRNFAGLRPRVLARDGRACQVCGRLGTGKRSLHVHHRQPGLSRERLLITLCPGHHAIIHHLLLVRRLLPARLLELWREQHPGAPEQLPLNFDLSLSSETGETRCCFREEQPVG